MTLDETRQLGIEFERRLITIDPTMETNKIDTEDIYSFLNQYQRQFVRQMYLQQDKTEVGTNAYNKIWDYIKGLIKTGDFTIDSTDNTITVKDFNMYISSYTNITGSYNSEGTGKLSNEYIGIKDQHRVLDALFDEGRIIRRPLITPITETKFQITCDSYTKADSVHMTYLSNPTDFSILSDKACSMPVECSEELISGAVDLYFSYKYKVSLAQQAARRNRANQQTNQQEDEQ